MKFDKLFEELSKYLPIETTDSGNELIRIPNGGIKVRVGNYGSDIEDDTYANVVCVSRHFVSKPIYEISIKSSFTGKDYILKTTADHTCMRISDKEDAEGNFVFEQVSAKDLKKGDNLCICDIETWFGHEECDTKVPITKISVDENKDGSWVYDLEVDSSKHVYFANGVLVHNSQFINLSPITKFVLGKDGKDQEIPFSKASEDEQKKVISDAYHIVDLANENVANLVNDTCHTSHGDVLHYSLEYIAAEGMYFKKKHYIVRKVLSDDIACNKFKYSGISVKKAEIPESMKDFLKKIYESTMTEEWSESKYRKEVENAYSQFIKLDWTDIAYYKKYRTLKQTISLTESEKGAGVHARAANFYNQLIEKLGIAGKYSKIGVGDEFRYAYILPTNEYGMDCIAFKDSFPEEFRKMFKPDYEKMFEKIFTKSLENYVNIMHYRTADPTKMEEDPDFVIF